MDRAILREHERRAIQAALSELQRTLKAAGKPWRDGDVAQLVGVSQQAINKAVKRAAVGPAVARSLCDYLAIDMSTLVKRYAPADAVPRSALRVPPDAVWRGAREVLKLPKYGAAAKPYLEFLAAMQSNDMSDENWERLFDEVVGALRHAEERSQLEQLRAAATPKAKKQASR